MTVLRLTSAYLFVACFAIVFVAGAPFLEYIFERSRSRSKKRIKQTRKHVLLPVIVWRVQKRTRHRNVPVASANAYAREIRYLQPGDELIIDNRFPANETRPYAAVHHRSLRIETDRSSRIPRGD